MKVWEKLVCRRIHPTEYVLLHQDKYNSNKLKLFSNLEINSFLLQKNQ